MQPFSRLLSSIATHAVHVARGLIGHRTASVFRRYNVVTEEELQEVKWKTEESRGVHIGVHRPRKTGEFG